MSEFRSTQPPGADARRLALEIIATLVYVKRLAADHVLRPAGVPADLVQQFLTERDSTTGQPLTKRQAGALMLEELARRDNADQAIVQKLIALAASWDSFHLSQDEYKARAIVEKARELAGIFAKAAERQVAEQNRMERERAERQRRERDEAIRRQSNLLLAQFDQASADGDHRQRGYLLEDLLNRLFLLHNFSVVRAFTRNAGGEQIDGAFEMEGWHYLVECRWRAKLADIRELDGLAGQVARSGRQTMGLFLSINGWSGNVVPLLKQNPDKTIILMEGVDLRTLLATSMDPRHLLKAKLSALNLDAEPYFPVATLFKG